MKNLDSWNVQWICCVMQSQISLKHLAIFALKFPLRWWRIWSSLNALRGVVWNTETEFLFQSISACHFNKYVHLLLCRYLYLQSDIMNIQPILCLNATQEHIRTLSEKAEQCNCNWTIRELAVSVTTANSLQTARLMKMWLRSLNSMHTSLCGPIKKTFSLSHMKERTQLEECSGWSDKGDSREGNTACFTHAHYRPNIKQRVHPNYKKTYFSQMSSHQVWVRIWKHHLFISVVMHPIF